MGRRTEGGKARRPRGVASTAGVNACSFVGEEPKVASSSRTGEARSVSRRILITGGARAGKSRFARELAEQGNYRQRFYVATAVVCDPEMREKIARHRKERDRRWKTVEEPLRLPERLPLERLASPSVFLIDCLPTFLTNHLLQKATPSGILRRVDRLVQSCRRPGLTAIWVTNEVGLGVVPDHPMGRRFRDLLGEANQRAAAAADEVYLLVAGLPVRIK